MFGSDHIKARVTELLLRHQREDLFTFVSRENSPLFAQLRGDCFEVLAHEKLAAGGDFRTRILSPPGSKDVVRSLSKAALRRFSGNNPGDLVSILDCVAGDYCQPVTSNFPVIDALIFPSMLLQMTVSLQHAVDEPKLAQILDALSLSSAELHFVVPPDKYSGFKPHKFKDATLGKRITQVALCVSFDVAI
jgi:hypothetical protein